MLSSLLLSGCTPLFHPPGKPTAIPRLTESAFLTKDGVKLPLRVWLPEEGELKALIIALHGFNDYSHFFAEPALYFKKQGIGAYAYDQRGFGGSPRRGLWAGREAYAHDLTVFTDLVRARHPGIPVYVLGESMGGAVVILAMTGENPPAADGVILSAPAIWGRKTMPWYQRWALWFGAHLAPGAAVTGESLQIMPSDNIEMLRKLSRDPLIIKETRIATLYGLANLMDAALERSVKLDGHTLILYGEKDEIIPPYPFYLMLQNLKQDGKRRIALYENGYHMLLRDLEAAIYWQDIAAWIEDSENLLPSGADRRVNAALAQFEP